MYPTVHKAVTDIIQEHGGGEGLILHVAYPTEEGFDVVEVWESREHAERFDTTVLTLALQRAGAEDRPAPVREEFDPLGVMVPSESGQASEAGIGGA
jgi:hypothetical protein